MLNKKNRNLLMILKVKLNFHNSLYNEEVHVEIFFKCLEKNIKGKLIVNNKVN